MIIRVKSHESITVIFYESLANTFCLISFETSSLYLMKSYTDNSHLKGCCIDVPRSVMTEFLSKCSEVYQVMLQNRSSGLETVVVPTSQQRTHTAAASAAHGDSSHATAGAANDGVDSSLFQRTLVVIGDKMDIALAILHNVLSLSNAALLLANVLSAFF